MELSKEFIETNKLSEDQVKAVTEFGKTKIVEVETEWKDKAHKDAQGILSGAAMSVEKLLKAAPQIKNEVSDLSEAETQELESWIHENYEFNNLTVNELIDATFDIFNGVTKIVAAFKK